MKKILVSGLIALMLLSIAVFSEHQVNTFEPDKDSKVAKAQSNANFGLGVHGIVNDKQTGTDRIYQHFDLSNSGLASVNNADIEMFVYWTGSQVVGSVIQAWYCDNTDFGEATITWNNQPKQWDVNGNPITITPTLLYGKYLVYRTTAGNGCVLADSYTVPNKVIAGTPETKHFFDLTPEVNNELANGDGRFTVVLKHDTENMPNNYKYVQYLMREYSESAYRPQLVIS